MTAFRRASRSTVTDAESRSAHGDRCWVILALGNPGPQYADSRHNVGWWVANSMLKRHSARLTDAGICHQATIRIADQNVIVALPKTYVNRSGAAARVLLQRHGIEPSRLLVICDDINLPVGVIRVRKKGGAGGHNGLASTISEIGTEQFPRIRIGVGRQSQGASQVDHVLGTPSGGELADLRLAVERAAEAATVAIEEGLDTAMNRYNGRAAPQGE